MDAVRAQSDYSTEPLSLSKAFESDAALAIEKVRALVKHQLVPDATTKTQHQEPTTAAAAAGAQRMRGRTLLLLPNFVVNPLQGFF